MTLPEIPEATLAAIREAAGYIDVGSTDDLDVWREELREAWPHLYAAALRHAATLAGKHPLFHEFEDWIDRLAREATQS